MKLVSVNTGLPRDVMWHGKNVTSAIFKQPFQGRVALRKLSFDGDRQADLSVHGGEYKAVYCYPIAHYDYWKRELPGRELPLGMFGENFTTDGLLENSVHIGDQFSVGSGRSGGNAASPPLLQARREISSRRHGEAIPGKRADGLLPCRHS